MNDLIFFANDPAGDLDVGPNGAGVYFRGGDILDNAFGFEFLESGQEKVDAETQPYQGYDRFATFYMDSTHDCCWVCYRLSKQINQTWEF